MLAAACSDDESSTTTTTAAAAESAFPVTIGSGDDAVTIAERPDAIISLSPTATEMLFAIGAGEQVSAVDDQSNYPPEAPTSDLSGFTPNVESIIALSPDLVVISGDANGLVAGLDAASIPTLVQPAASTFDDVYAQIEDLGAATGNVDGAVEVVADMKSGIDAAVSNVAETQTSPTYYHELDPTLFTVTSSTFIGEIYALAGLTNIADSADPDGAFAGYPQLSAEFLINADPDFIFLADTKCCEQNAATVAARPGFAQLSAVANNQVIELDDDIASRWGPRSVDFLKLIIAATNISTEGE
jgi:iron complex transport system substrate-binding protein